MSRPSLRAVTFLAPNMFRVYQAITDAVGKHLGLEINLAVGENYDDVSQADLCFICGLPYVLRTRPRVNPASLEAIAAPVLVGERYQGKPIYFSDVIVRRDSPYQSFVDLRGCSWAFNEEESQSGYGITRYTLVKLGETTGFFGKVSKAGFHQKAIRMVCDGEVDATAIDSQVLAVELRNHPNLADHLRIVGVFGPSTVQPIAVSTTLTKSLKEDIRSALLHIHNIATVRAEFDRNFIDRIAAVGDSTYDDIREMLAVCERANFLWLR